MNMQRRRSSGLNPGLQRRPLGEFCKEDRVLVVPSSEGAARLPYLSLEHIESGSGRILARPEGQPEDKGRGATFRFTSHHVLYGKLRPYLNKVALPQADGRCTTEAIPLRPAGEMTREYLAWLLRRPATVEWVMREKTGSRMPRANMDHLLSMPVHVPCREEQLRIAGAITQQMKWMEQAKLAAADRASAAAALPRAILKMAFRNIVPLTTNPKQASPAPQGWTWVPLNKLAELASGHTPSRKRPEWWGGDVPWLALPDIRALDGTLAMDTAEHTNEDGIANSSARVLPTGTVCMCRTGSVGLVTILGRPMATSQGFANWICGDDLDNWFLLYLLTSSRQHLRTLADGALVKDIYMPTVEAFRVCVPPISEQRRIVARVREELAAASRLMNATSAEMQALNDMPAALLRAAFGED